MSHFVSWCECKIGVDKSGANKYEYLFLDHDDAYNTAKGKEIRKRTVNWTDLCGHGALYSFYEGIENGYSRECENFSSPEFFPARIVKAIKECKFVGIGYNVKLLTPNGEKEFKERIQKLAKPMEKELKPLKKELKLVEAEITKMFESANTGIDKLYRKRDAILLKLQNVRNDYWYKKTEIFWKMFKFNKYRKIVWRDMKKKTGKRKARVAYC
jgi:hypothetical protein